RTASATGCAGAPSGSATARAPSAWWSAVQERVPAPGDLGDLHRDEHEAVLGDPGVDPLQADLPRLVALEHPCLAAGDDAPGVVGLDVVDLERDVLVHDDAEQLAALRGPEDQPVAVDGVVDRGDVHLVEEVVGQAPELP